VTAKWHSDRIVVVSCAACQSVVRIEFDPPDAPTLRGRIEPLFTPGQDEGQSEEDVAQ
jgi:hypothetical protein